jgi:hypothetical protein
LYLLRVPTTFLSCARFARVNSLLTKPPTRFGYAQDLQGIAVQKKKNEEIKQALRRSQIVFGSDAPDYHSSNAMPHFSGATISNNKYTIDPEIAKGLRRTK